MLAARKTKSAKSTATSLKLVSEIQLPPPQPRPGPETHYLLRCHRIALDFGPRAAERAMEMFDNAGDTPDTT